MDSLLGSMALGDIGKHFPDSSEEYKNASSINLLVRVKKMLEEHGARVVNVDATVVLQSPKIAGYIDSMRSNVAFALGVDVSRVSVKATTEEHLGFTGRSEGVSAHAVSLVEIVK
jgi:2-C-methyl-D-erythritol 2,4-cyclodiphosphate synthase